jgi:hypothetical protein
MLIVLYDNNMLRLWNLLDGRCIYKRKLGVDPETNKVAHKALGVKWEPTEGKLFSILYEKKLEVFNAEASEPLSTVTTETAFNCFEFVSPTEIITGDVQGKLTFIKNIQDEAKTTITLINTKIARFRDLRCFPGTGTLVACSSTEGKLCFYDVEDLRRPHLEVSTAKPNKSIKSKSRFLCLCINHLQKEEVASKGVPKKASKKAKKAIGKKKKLGKDERKIL